MVLWEWARSDPSCRAGDRQRAVLHIKYLVHRLTQLFSKKVACFAEEELSLMEFNMSMVVPTAPVELWNTLIDVVRIFGLHSRLRER